MPIYFFDVLDNSDVVSDDEGIDFPDVEAARRETIKAAREQIADAAKQGLDVTHPVLSRPGSNWRSRV